MRPAKKLRLSPAVIGLDLVGSLLLAVGVLNVITIEPGILPPMLVGKSLGWPLLIAGIGLMSLAAVLLVAPLLKIGRKTDINPTVDRTGR